MESQPNKDESIPRSRQYRNAIIESNRDSAAYMARFLQILGHEAHIATDGRAGVELVTRIEPDLVLSCTAPAKLDGYEVAEAIRRDFDRKPVIAAHSGYSKREIGEHLKASGFDYYLAKPASIDELKRLIGSLDGSADCEDLRL